MGLEIGTVNSLRIAGISIYNCRVYLQWGQPT